jgi:sigma-B regulation protein RsbU (phosphoserine phosphatase)
MAIETGRLLVVDDVEMNRDLLSRRLAQQGHSVALAENGRRALEMVRAGDFDLVLLDIMMPEVDGYHVLKEMMDDPVLKHIPVVMISAVTEMDSVVRCIEMGATDYLPKPFNPVLLKARVGATLEKKRLRDKERLWARSLERELEIGREIQKSFLPEELPRVPGWEIAARFQPARQVAGDFYDAFALPEAGRIGLVVADVCDKGVGAALFMALFRSLLRATATGDSARQASDPAA